MEQGEKLLVQSHEFHVQIAGQPEIAGVIGAEVVKVGQDESANDIDVMEFDVRSRNLANTSM
jgi:hypothetical protein